MGLSILFVLTLGTETKIKIIVAKNKVKTLNKYIRVIKVNKTDKTIPITSRIKVNGPNLRVVASRNQKLISSIKLFCEDLLLRDNFEGIS